MFIERLELKNYAAIKAGMGLDHIIIEIPRNGKKVVILNGPNGTGKSAILDQLQPYSTSVGNVRSGSKNTITDKKQGYKSITYSVSGNTIVIKHFVAETTTKSYISKNGVELNQNGNVTSFKEIVEKELNITEDTIKLMKLGTNTSTFLKMGASKRKEFTADIMSSLDIYYVYYKTLSDKYRSVRALIKSVSSKISALNVIDEESLDKDINNMRELLNVNKQARDSLVGDRAKVVASADECKGYTPRMYMDEISILEKSRDMILLRLSSIGDDSLDRLSIELSDIMEREMTLSSKFSRLETELEGLLNTKDETANKLDEINSKLKLITSTEEEGSLIKLKVDYEGKLKSLESRFDNFSPKASVEDFKRLLVIMKDLTRLTSITNEFSTAAVVDVVNRMLMGENVDHAITLEYKARARDLEVANSKLIAVDADKTQVKRVLVFKKDSGCNCPFESFYNMAAGIDKSTRAEVNKEIRQIEKDIEVIDEKVAVLNNIKLIRMTIEANKEIVNRLPEDVLSLDKVIRSMADNVPIYDEESITTYINILEDYESMKDIRTKLVKVQEELNKINGSSDMITMLNSELITLRSRIDKVDISIVESMAEKETVSSKLLTIRESKEAIHEKITNFNALSHLHDELKVVNDEIADKVRKKQLMLDVIPTLTEIDKKLRKVETDIEFCDKNLSIMLKKKETMMELKAELVELNDKYEKIEILRDAVSSRVGIPLEYVKLFMSDINSHINSLIHRVYGDKIVIQKFLINDKDFTIPYTSNGLLVPDVSMVSQGEETFVSLALSFAFILRAIEEQGGIDYSDVVYNVICMDELDGPLDTKNRNHFLEIIEEQLRLVEAEQIFLISHNEVFNSYPCNGIITSPDVRLDAYRNMTVVFRPS